MHLLFNGGVELAPCLGGGGGGDGDGGVGGDLQVGRHCTRAPSAARADTMTSDSVSVIQR